MSPTTGSTTLARWRQRMLDLGLNPDLDGIDIPIIRHTDSLEEYKRWWGFPPRSDSKVNKVDPAKIAKIPEALVRRYVQEHITNARVFTNPKSVRALEKRVGRFFVHVQAVPGDRICTADDPIIVNATNSITNYETITMANGGYIEISVPCVFEAQAIKKVQGGTSPGRAYDVFVVGNAGKDATDGVSPVQPPQAPNGRNAKCDCCGGAVSQKATDGTNGATGTNGRDATTDATDGTPGPTVHFFIHDSFSGSGGLTFLNQGGNGGSGGRGGHGAKGGQGGNGGDGITCGGIFSTGGTGGRGGAGGVGGNGSNGKNGGRGGTLSITVPQPAARNMIVTNGRAPGGLAGAKGTFGAGGEGGKGGGHGGKNGGRGADGASDGKSGEPGSPGEQGSSFVNDIPVVS